MFLGADCCFYVGCLLPYIFPIIKPQLALGNNPLCHTYGEVILRAWREAQKSSSSSSTLASATSLCLQIEYSIQDLVREAMQASDRRYFKGLRIVLSSFSEAKRFKEIDSLLVRLYAPHLWRLLVCANALVRSQAAVLFFDVFPLQSFESTQTENEILFQRQLEIIHDLLRDPDHRVRTAAATGVTNSLREYWEIFPLNSIQSILTAFISNLAQDASSIMVRQAAIQGLSQLLDQPLALMVMKGILPLTHYSLHDKADSVRIAFIQLLIKVNI